jgi:hypothetical protein
MLFLSCVIWYVNQRERLVSSFCGFDVFIFAWYGWRGTVPNLQSAALFRFIPLPGRVKRRAMCRERRQVGRRKLESWMNVEIWFLWSSVDKNMSPDSA